MRLIIILIALFTVFNFISAQTTADAHFDVLDNQYRQNNNKESSVFLIDEFKEFLHLYPNSKQEDEALFNLSELYKTNNDIPGQLFSLIKLRILQPKSPLGKMAYQIIDSLVIYNNELLLNDENEKAIKEINNRTPVLDYQLAHIELLSFFHFAEIRVLENLFIAEIRDYKSLFGQHSDNIDAVNYWQACAYFRMGDLNAALLNFKKVTDIYPNSEFTAPSLLQMAKIYNKTDKQNRATDCLIELINQFPDNPETGDAQYQLAQIYHYHFKDLNEALTNYKMLAQVFPENQYFNFALTNAAKISESMGDYEGALDSYMMIVENNIITDETLTSLKNILRIHLDIQKDYDQAAQDYILIAQMFPDNKNAALNLYKAAKLYKENLKDDQKAKEIVQIILSNYTDSIAAKKAAKIFKRE